MTSVCFPGMHLVDCYAVTDVARYQNVAAPSSSSFFSLPADVVGDFSLTLTNVVVGSAIRIEVASTGAEVVTRTATSSTEVFSIPAYVTGSANNDLRIKVRKGSSAPFYIPYETLTTAFAGSASIYIAQTRDD